MKRRVLASIILLISAISCAPMPTPMEMILTLTPTTTLTPRPTFTETPIVTLTPLPTSTPDVPTEAISFTTEDDLTIAGTLFGKGDVAVLLLHMGLGSVDQHSWHDFAQLLAEEGYTALAIDFRGRGASEGNYSRGLATNLIIKDARAAVKFLQARGYNRLVCMGASMGGTTCLRLALEVDLEGVVVIASTISIGPDNKVTIEDLRQLAIPKLFIVGSRDIQNVVSDMSIMYKVAQEPKEEIIYDNAAHGTNLLLSPFGDDLRQQLLKFLDALG